MPAGSSVPPYRFPTTHWSLIGRAGDTQHQANADALNELLRRYWPALKAHLVHRRGVDPHQADDLVQGFIESRVLERRLLATADRQRGKFRTLLATALDNYAINQWQRAQAKKRAADHAANADCWEALAADTASPDNAMDVAWARQVLSETLDRMRTECKVCGRAHFWELFSGRIAEPILTGAEPIAYSDIVRRGWFASPAQASNALITTKRMFARILREVVSQYATDADEVDAEIATLQNALAHSR